MIYKRSDVRRASEVWVFIDENDWRDAQRGYNQGSFMVPRTGDSWVDPPGTWHSDGACLSFVDGHVEYKHWDDNRTLKLHDFNSSTPNNRDLKWLQSITGPQ